MKKTFIVIFIIFIPIMAFSQTEIYNLYNKTVVEQADNTICYNVRDMTDKEIINCYVYKAWVEVGGNNQNRFFIKHDNKNGIDSIIESTVD